MDAVLKQYFWVFNLVFLAIAAWLMAGIINVGVAHKLRPLPSATSDNPRKSTLRRDLPEQDENNNVIVERNFFQSALTKVSNALLGDPAANGIDSSQLEGEGVPTSMRANLVGTLVADDPSWSMAVIKDQNKNETNVYRVDGSFMDEATIVAITATKVIFNRNGAREYLEMQDKNAKKAVGSPALSSAAYPSPGSGDVTPGGEGIKQIGEGKYVIAKAEIDKTLGNLNNIAMQARIIPSFKNGEADGFRLFAIRPGSLYSKLGVQNGDVIHKINGYAINSPEKGWEIFQKLKTARTIDIELTSRGVDKALNFKIE